MRLPWHRRHRFHASLSSFPQRGYPPKTKGTCGKHGLTSKCLVSSRCHREKHLALKICNVLCSVKESETCEGYAAAYFFGFLCGNKFFLMYRRIKTVIGMRDREFFAATCTAELFHRFIHLPSRSLL